MVKGIALGSLCFLLFLFHIPIFHYLPIKRRFFTILKMFFLGLFTYTLLFLLIREESITKIVTIFIPISLLVFFNGTFIHFFFYYFYLHLIEVVDRSPSTRIMVEIENSPGKKLAFEEVRQVYSLDEKINAELEDMVILGRFSQEEGSYILTPKGRMHTRIFQFVRNYLKLERN